MHKHSEFKGRIKGHVTGHFFDPATGHECMHFEQNNVTSYLAADIMARMLGNDTEYVPRYMGFIYGQTGTPGAALIEPPVSRTQTWDDLSDELSDAGVTGNVLIAPFSTNPSYSVDGSSSNYSGNAVTFAAHSGTRFEYGFDVASPYQDELADSDYYYQAMLITRLVSGSDITYLPFARVTLKNGSYLQKPAGYELALFWQISYF